MLQYGNIFENFGFTHGLRHGIMASHTGSDVTDYSTLTVMHITLGKSGEIRKNAENVTMVTKPVQNTGLVGPILVIATVDVYYLLKISSCFMCNWRKFGQNIRILLD